MAKRRWTFDEESRLKEGVEKCNINTAGSRTWKEIAETYVISRNGKQCFKQWRNVLDPELSKEPWTSEEDEKLKNAAIEQYKQAYPGLDAQAIINRQSCWPKEF